MYHPMLISLFGNQASPPDVAVLVTSLVGVLIALVLDIYCMNYCLRDLDRRATVTGANKQLWAILIIMGGPLGQAAYWLYGRGGY
jgi:hypothetical protein